MEKDHFPISELDVIWKKIKSRRKYKKKTIGNWLARKAGVSITSTKLNRETD